MLHANPISIPPVASDLVDTWQTSKSDEANQAWRWGDASRLRSMMGPAISFLLHLLIILGLALLVIPGRSPMVEPNLITASFSDSDSLSSDFELSPIVNLELNQPEMTHEQPSATSSMEAVPIDVALPEVKIENELPSTAIDWRLFAIDPSASSPLTKNALSKAAASPGRLPARSVAANLSGGKASGLGSGQGGSKPSGASYFGTRAEGNKFVFIVDKSSSMKGLRWHVAVQELIRSLYDLRTDTKFFVICFDSTESPIFGKFPSKDAYLTSNAPTLNLVQQWIGSLQPFGSTRPSGALTMALSMEPSAIFLLSDGELRDNSVEMLRTLNFDVKTKKARVPIHTVLLMSYKGGLQLKTIAAESGGVFRQVSEQEWLAAQRIEP